MHELSLVEHSHATKNAMLAARVAKALRSEGRHDAQSTRVLRRGAEFLHRVIESAVLVEPSHQLAGVQASARGLDEFGRALSALRILKRLAEDERVAETLDGMRKDLLRLSSDERVSGERRENLRRFFSTLSLVFEQQVLGAPPMTSSSSPPEIRFTNASTGC